MKVLIVSGFLGAGKTTFIREMSRKTSLDFVVMENEYGEVGIDADLLDNDRQMDTPCPKSPFPPWQART